jgi:hypothetical protein
MNKTNSVDLSNFSSFNSLYFSVGNVLMLANSFEGSGKLPRGSKLWAFTVFVQLSFFG